MGFESLSASPHVAPTVSGCDIGIDTMSSRSPKIEYCHLSYKAYRNKTTMFEPLLTLKWSAPRYNPDECVRPPRIRDAPPLLSVEPSPCAKVYASPITQRNA